MTKKKSASKKNTSTKTAKKVLKPKNIVVKEKVVETKTLYNKSHCRIELVIEGKVYIVPQGGSVQVPKNFVVSNELSQLVR